MVSEIRTTFQNFCHLKQTQFNRLANEDRARVIAKTLIVAGTFSFVAGLLFGKKVKAIVFTGTAIFLASQILDRVSAFGYLITLKAAKTATNLANAVLDTAENCCIGGSRMLEDILGTDNPRQVATKRSFEDQQIAVSRLFTSIISEIKLVMSL